MNTDIVELMKKIREIKREMFLIASGSDKRFNESRGVGEFCRINAMDFLGKYASEVFYRMSLEELCALDEIEYISVDDDVALVTFAWTENSPKQAFLLWKSCNVENKGGIRIRINGFWQEYFHSVCLCQKKYGCGQNRRAAKMLTDTVRIAKKHRIERIFTRIKQDAFEVGSIVFEEITSLENKSSTTKRFGEDAELTYDKFFP